MKFLRTQGNSYTQNSETASNKKLQRGLRPYLQNREIVTPEELEEQIQFDPEWMIKQSISELDKVCRKPNKFKNYNKEAYVNRSKLAEALWELLAGYFQKEKNLSKDAIFFLKQEKWLWKIHPNAPKEYNPKAPETDNNAKFLDKQKNTDKSPYLGVRSSFYNDVNSSPKIVAKEIYEHLFVQQLNGEGKTKFTRKQPQVNKPKETGVGFVAERANAIINSANDPRLPADPLKKSKQKIVVRNLDQYLQNDSVGIAQEIHSTLSQLIVYYIRGEEEYSPKKASNTPAKLLYEYFGSMKPSDAVSEQEKKDHTNKLFPIHLIVKNHYAKAVRNHKFRQLFMPIGLLEDKDLEIERRIKALKNSIPETNSSLKKQLLRRENNRDYSRLIRLGKLIAHASDTLPLSDTSDSKLNDLFNQKLDELVKSSGQAKIKRDETFTRTWRMGVNSSFQTLRGLIETESFQIEKNLHDLSGATESKAVFNSITNNKEFQPWLDNLNILFGNDKKCGSTQTSRADIFTSTTDVPLQETFWGLMRVAANLRHKVTHFNLKPYLLDAFEKGFVCSFDKKQRNIDNRAGNKVSAEFLKKCSDLLKFDENLLAYSIEQQLEKNELRQLELDDVTFDKILKEMASFYDENLIPVPRFKGVLNRAKNLQKDPNTKISKNTKIFEGLFIKEDTETQNKQALLEMLYGGGFTSWLKTKENEWGTTNTAEFHTILENLLSYRKDRKKQYYKDNKKFYVPIDEFLEPIVKNNENKGLKDLLCTISSLIATTDQDNKGYKEDREKQSAKTTALENFRRDLFIELFGKYLHKRELTPLLDAKWHSEPLNKRAIKIVPQPLRDENAKDKEEKMLGRSQFYTWLYLLQNSDVALLRNQIRKTEVLEASSHDKQIVLKELVKLMGLYLRVNKTGFNGTEHQPFKKSFTIGEGNILFEKDEFFATLFDDESETHSTSLSKTRSSLRDLIRFGHLKRLQGVFLAHRIKTNALPQNSSFRASMLNKQNDISAGLTQAQELRNKITKAKEKFKKTKGDKTKLTNQKQHYKETIWNIRKNEFDIRKYRLDDFTRLHHVMVRILSRLTDYTATWERDRHYLFLAHLYETFNGLTLTIKQDDKYGKRLCIVLDKSTQLNNKGSALSGKSNERDLCNLQSKLLELWHETDGIALERNYGYTDLLKGEDFNRFKKFFIETDYETHDHKNEEFKRRYKYNRVTKNKLELRRPQKKTIRNDFAHHNVLFGTQAQRVNGQKIDCAPSNFTYLVNTVRSLMAYDKKAKNSVTKSIIKILNEEGIHIQWRMSGDRVVSPIVLPLAYYPFAFMGGYDAKLALPRVSPTFISMVKGLFDVRESGYSSILIKTENIKKTEKKKIKQIWETEFDKLYPSQLPYRNPKNQAMQFNQLDQPSDLKTFYTEFGSQIKTKQNPRPKAAQ